MQQDVFRGIIILRNLNVTKCSKCFNTTQSLCDVKGLCVGWLTVRNNPTVFFEAIAIKIIGY